MPDDHDLLPVEHDPFAHETEAVDHDPFQNGELLPPELASFDPQKQLQALAALDQRVFQVEMAIARAVYEIRDALAGMAANVQNLHASHERLRSTIAAPKRIIRDADGRPTGVVVDQSL